MNPYGPASPGRGDWAGFIGRRLTFLTDMAANRGWSAAFYIAHPAAGLKSVSARRQKLCTQECVTGSTIIGGCPVTGHYILSVDTGVAAANPALTPDA
jgi:hypothetical protein